MASNALKGVACAAEASSAKESNASSSALTDALEAPVQTFETDVLIIGAGNAANSVAWSVAREGGLRVMMVDKGPYLRSGSTNPSFPYFNLFIDIDTESPLDEYQVSWLGKPFGKYLINKRLMRNALNMYADGGRDSDIRNRAVAMLNRGQYLPSRDETGAVIPYAGDMCLNQMFTHELEELIGKVDIQILDRTMVTEFLIQDGRCCGVVGLYLPTGEIRVIRAKTVVAATSGCIANYATQEWRPDTGIWTDSTFDLEMSMYRHGQGIAENEYAQFAIDAIEPAAIGNTSSSVYTGAQSPGSVVHANGERVFAEGDETAGDRNHFAQELGRVISEEGHVYIDLSAAADQIFLSDLQTERNQMFGVDVSKHEGLLEAIPSIYEHGGSPLVDDNLKTAFEGLYWVRGAGIYGECGGTCVFQNHIFGNYAGYQAAQYAKTCDELPSFDANLVDAERKRLDGIFTHQAEGGDGLRPIQIRHEIENAFYPAFGTYRTTEALESGISELERIQREDMPRQQVSDTSKCGSREFREAIENENLLYNSLMSLRSTMMREESRGSYMRPDFPDQDDENWACMIVCRDQDGEMVLEKQDVPGIDAQ
jgi:succinate dehydrogenase/fumarate reductase flavoprotein subunit